MSNIVELYSTSPQFVLGFHGCDKSVADKVIKDGEMLKSSTNDYDWLGSGIYFWEQNYQRALDWAKECAANPRSSITTPAVVGAIIDLGLCLDMLNSSSIHELKAHYEYFESLYKLTGEQMPINSNFLIIFKLYRRKFMWSLNLEFFSKNK